MNHNLKKKGMVNIWDMPWHYIARTKVLFFPLLIQPVSFHPA